ncbi:MAG: glycerophosphodiester phosphodiesterase [Sphingobacteriaceae bacterium]|nr:glycerophosphodiester phosphodiesterase [Sphingobacteriaceae bacterium]
MRILSFVFLVILTTNVMAQNTKWHKNQVIAHRGAWKKNNLPQNSIASLKEAIRLGCFGAEFDVHLTADSVLVVNHDHDLQGMKIETSTFDSLLTKTLSNGEKIPTLFQYLNEGKRQNKTKLILEIKPSMVSKERSLLLARKCVEMVQEHKIQDWVEYISFDYDILKEVLKLDKKAKVSYLKGDVAAEQIKADKFYGVDYHLSVFQKDNSWFTKAKSLGIILNSWTVNKEEDMKWLLDNKVEYITTNEPELLFEILAQQGK